MDTCMFGEDDEKGGIREAPGFGVDVICFARMTGSEGKSQQADMPVMSSANTMFVYSL